MTGVSPSRLPLEKILVVLVAVSLLTRLHLAFVYEINWDEFLNLSMVHDHARGNLRDALQTIFVHGFGWIGAVSVNEVDQVVAARLAVYALGVATAGFLYLICRCFLPFGAALFAVLCYLSFSFVLRQGNSFRTDPMAAFLLMAVLWLIVCRPAQLRYAVIAGGLTGLAGMVTIKSIFYVPTIAVILLVRLASSGDRRNALLYGLVTGGIAILGFLVFLFLHRMMLVDSADPLAFLQRTTGKTMGERDFRNAAANFRIALWQNPVFWLAACGGVLACLRGLIRPLDGGRARWTILLSFGAILGSLFVYTESFAYYYPFMLAPVAVLCGVGLNGLPEGLRHRAAAILCIPLGLMMLGNYLLALGKDNTAQHRTLEVVHRIFPQPVPYIDRTSMVSAYPKRGFFMSGWGMTDYYRAGVPVMRQVIERDQPRFLLANRRMLDLDDLEADEYGPAHFGLLKQDLAALKSNYIHHWGAIYVAGKTLGLSRAGLSRNFDILIEGPYTVESPGPVMLDGEPVQPNGVVTLAAGAHRLEMPAPAGEVTLRWGDNLYRPAEPAPEGPLFNGF